MPQPSKGLQTTWTLYIHAHVLVMYLYMSIRVCACVKKYDHKTLKESLFSLNY